MKGNGRIEQLVDREHVIAAIRVVAEPGGVFEVRVLDGVMDGERRALTYSGYFNDAKRAAEALALLRSAGGIYITMNPVEPSLLARSVNKLRVASKNCTTADHNIIRRNWLLFDFDAVRAAGIAASDSEHRAALALAEQARDWLTEQGFPLPAFCDSGNGGHLLYRVEIPGDDAGLVEQCLKVMARRWDTDAVHVDVTVFNPARIVRLYG